MNTARMLALIGFLALAVPGIGLLWWASSTSEAILTTPIRVDHPPRMIVEPVSVSRGEHLVRHVLDCAGCHAEDYGGKVVMDHALLGRFVAPNLTSGAGGIGGTLDTEGWDKAIRHGVDGDSRPLLYCPAERYATLSDQDLESVIRYLRSIRPVNRELLDSTTGPLFPILLATGSIELAATTIDHAHRPPTPEPGPTGEYGHHLATLGGCLQCHGDDLAGQPGPPGAPAAPAIHSDALRGWLLDDLKGALREGTGSDGLEMDPYMPWEAYRGLTDEEVTALWRYLKYTGAKAEG